MSDRMWDLDSGCELDGLVHAAVRALRAAPPEEGADHGREESVPSYSNDLEAAMSLIQLWLAAKEDRTMVLDLAPIEEVRAGSTTPGFLQRVCFYDATADEGFPGGVGAEGETVPVAVCRAFLMTRTTVDEDCA